MNRTIDQFTLSELRSLKIRLEAQIRAKGGDATESEKKLLKKIVDEMQSRSDYTYDSEVLGNVGKQKAIGNSSTKLIPHERDPHAYRSLADCYTPGDTSIWYFKPGKAKGFFDAIERHDPSGLPDPKNLSDTHVKLGTIDSDNPRQVYSAMQGETWSPKGEAKELVKKLGLGHISMSPGDVIQTPEATIMVTNHSFYNLGSLQEAEEAFDFSAVIDGKRSLQEGPAPMAFNVGDQIFYGSRAGKLLGFAGGDRAKLVVELPNGERDIFPSQGTTLKKPSVVRRATQWAMGENEELDEKEIRDHSPVATDTPFKPDYSEGQILYQGSYTGKFVRYADGLRKQMLLVKLPNGQHAMFNAGKASTKPPKFIDQAKSFFKGESVNENFTVGQTVYYGSKAGKLLGFAKDDRTKMVVELPNGERDIFPSDQAKVDKPSMIKRVGSWIVGEDEEVAEDFGSSDISIAMEAMVDAIKEQNGGRFMPTPATLEMAAKDVGSRYADDLGIDEEEAARIMQHHFMIRFRSGSLNKYIEDPMEEEVVSAVAGSAGRVNAEGGVVGEADLSQGIPRGAVSKPKMTDLHYFNTKGTPDFELAKLGMKKDKWGRFYLPQYDRSGDNYRRNYDTLAQTFGFPRSIRLKK
jgi:hypothetical protein